MPRAVAFDDVRVLLVTDFAAVYRVAGRAVTIAPLHIADGTTARCAGQRGRLVLPEWYAVEIGLIARRPYAVAPAPFAASSPLRRVSR